MAEKKETTSTKKATATKKTKAVAPKKVAKELAEKADAKKVAAKPAAKKVAPVKKTAAPKAPKNAPLAHGVGRRKKCVARVWLTRGKGDIVVNGLDYQSYFDTAEMRMDVERPLAVIATSKNYDIKANICGGGKVGQAGALKLGIARAFLAFDDQSRSDLKAQGLLTVDARVKERKKYGQRAARRKFQFVKR